MRFSCIVAIIVLCLGLSSAQQRNALAQPYQKVWAGPSQRGSGGCQNPYVHAPGVVCQQPCCPPSGPSQPKDATPRDALPDQPRAAAPGIAPGVFVSPPQSGEIEGPNRGFEIGDISLTLPEIKLGLPRLRCTGIKRFSRDARMITDTAAAPYVGNPYYAAAMAQSQTVNREAEPNEENESEKGAKKNDSGAKKSDENSDAATGACQSDLELRIQRLEGCFEMQVQALQSCIEELKAMRAAESAYQKSSLYVPQPVPYGAAEARSDVPIRSPQFLRPTAQAALGEEAVRMNYEVVTPANTASPLGPLRRLPATQ